MSEVFASPDLARQFPWKEYRNGEFGGEVFYETFSGSSVPGLTTMVKHDDHAMTWYCHDDSYSLW